MLFFEQLDIYLIEFSFFLVLNFIWSLSKTTDWIREVQPLWPKTMHIVQIRLQCFLILPIFLIWGHVLIVLLSVTNQKWLAIFLLFLWSFLPPPPLLPLSLLAGRWCLVVARSILWPVKNVTHRQYFNFFKKNWTASPKCKPQSSHDFGYSAAG